ncbi:hypothetical protein LGH70_08375 [Hymenobacter sp. BT635]|uniref:SH3b domain-containing protein n=1 Tax=Hymenobacter nitidus TaxID=2880929 RepID=A0ABS8AB16_9BACT|nr:hypothetical protein [Hymenobacter nitidus]MCB2377595.1 hypothetical protein [Hymenobacter nitidus]
MKLILTALFTLLLFPALADNSFCHVAIIRDADGYTNVRAEASGRASILTRVADDYAFEFDLEAFRNQEQWVAVWIPQERFGRSHPDIQGFMHRSRLRPLNTLPASGPGF